MGRAAQRRADRRARTGSRRTRMTTRIDAHQHYWRIGARAGYWPPAELDAIHRDFGPADLAPLLAAGRIDGTVLVQSLPTGRRHALPARRRARNADGPRGGRLGRPEGGRCARADRGVRGGAEGARIAADASGSVRRRVDRRSGARRRRRRDDRARTVFRCARDAAASRCAARVRAALPGAADRHRSRREAVHRARRARAVAIVDRRSRAAAERALQAVGAVDRGRLRAAKRRPACAHAAVRARADGTVRPAPPDVGQRLAGAAARVRGRRLSRVARRMRGRLRAMARRGRMRGRFRRQRMPLLSDRRGEPRRMTLIERN
ncbi:hypothetical protein BDAG_04798 [Burkholderia dolosa AU0158]|nr:hypothetical protein BDAG_04798 [Burkholderia dolosa AU0158]